MAKNIINPIFKSELAKKLYPNHNDPSAKLRRELKVNIALIRKLKKTGYASTQHEFTAKQHEIVVKALPKCQIVKFDGKTAYRRIRQTKKANNQTRKQINNQTSKHVAKKTRQQANKPTTEQSNNRTKQQAN